jgi:PAS domain S-box-containing protein
MNEISIRPSAVPDFQMLFEGSPNLYLVLDPQLTIVGVNDAYCRATMTQREAIVGRALFEVFPDNPDDADADGVGNLRASLQRVLMTGRPDAMSTQKYDIPRPASEGGGFDERYWSPLNTPVLASDGSVLWIIHRVEDVTQVVRLHAKDDVSENTIAQLRATNAALAQRNAEFSALQRELVASSNELKETSTFLNLVVENIPAMVAVKDADDLRFALLNRQGEELTGISREESLGKNDFDFFPPDQAQLFLDADRDVLASGLLRVIPEERIATRHRGERILRTLKMPVPDERGRPKYLLAMSEDITDRIHAEAALRESEALFGSLLEASADAVMAVNAEAKIVLANERFRTMYGYGPEELIGQHASILTPGRVLEDKIQRPGTALTEGAAGVVRDLTGLRRDGTEFPVEAALSQHETDKGPMIVISLRDVTERKAVELQLQQAQKMEAIGNLTGGLAHDFNNLLSVVIGNLDLLNEEGRDSNQGDQLVDEALSAALRGAELTRRLLAFARRQPLQPKSVDVNALVEDITKLIDRTVGGNILIDTRLGDDVWPVIADPIQLEACLVNLATNARDAMPKGGALTLSTANSHLDEDYAGLHPGLEPGNYTLIEVTDTGTGISKEVIDKIFEPFFTTKKEGKGTGLGLSMVFGFMKQSGGHINVYSEVGVGTTFRLYLPRAQTEAAAVKPVDAAGSAGGPETVLAVEDNTSLRNLVVRQLTKLGYKCLEAADGPSAIKVLEKEHVDLLFSDVVMPGGMTGYELGREARTRWPQIKVLLTSGFPEEKLNGNGGPPWNMRLLIKPYRKDDLARTLREVLAEEGARA